MTRNSFLLFVVSTHTYTRTRTRNTRPEEQGRATGQVLRNRTAVPGYSSIEVTAGHLPRFSPGRLGACFAPVAPGGETPPGGSTAATVACPCYNSGFSAPGAQGLVFPVAARGGGSAPWLFYYGVCRRNDMGTWEGGIVSSRLGERARAPLRACASEWVVVESGGCFWLVRGCMGWW